MKNVLRHGREKKMMFHILGFWYFIWNNLVKYFYE